jgi:hypothetical protein
VKDDILVSMKPEILESEVTNHVQEIPFIRKGKQKIFDDSQDFYYRPKIEYKTEKLLLGPAKLIAKKSTTGDHDHKKIFDISYEEPDFPIIKKK